MRSEKIILGQIHCEKALQVVILGLILYMPAPFTQSLALDIILNTIRRPRSDIGSFDLDNWTCQRQVVDKRVHQKFTTTESREQLRQQKR